MRIAVCFSGQTRTVIECEPNIKLFIGELLPYCDFFVHTWSTNSQPLYQQTTDEVGMIYTTVSPNVFEFIENAYSPKKIIIDRDDILKNKSKNHGRMERFYTWARSIDYKKEYEKENEFEYDYVLKLRFDVIYSPTIKLRDLLTNIKPHYFGAESIWMSSGYLTIDDCIWLSDSKTMNIASKWNDYFYLNDPSYVGAIKGDPGWHVYFVKYLILNGIYPYNMKLSEDKTWTIHRIEGTSFNPITEFDKCREVDKQLYWEDIKFEHLTIKDLRVIDEKMNKIRNYTSPYIDQTIKNRLI